jgi:hypothetical protein
MTDEGDPQRQQRSISRSDLLWIAIPLLLALAAFLMLGYMFHLARQSLPARPLRPAAVALR